MQRKQGKQWGYSSGKNFPTNPVVKVPYFHRWRCEFHHQSEELRSHKPWGMAKKKKKEFLLQGLRDMKARKGLKHTQRQWKSISQSRSWWTQGWIGAVVVQLLSHGQLLATPWTAAHQAPLSFTISQSLHKIMSTESVIFFNHLLFCHPLLLLPSISPSIRVFSNELVLCIKWPKYWSLYSSTSPSNEYSGLISWYRVWIFPWRQWERFWVFK